MLSTDWTCPEYNLLLCCSQPQLTYQSKENIESLLKEKINWVFLLEIATQQKVMPLLYRHLKPFSELIPSDIWIQLQESFVAQTGYNLFLAGELIKILNLLSSEEIPAIPYKGCVLAVSSYGNLALRQFNDLDILIDPSNREKAIKLLQSQGYHLTQKLYWENQLVSQDGRVNIDLHQAITPKFFPVFLDFDQLWQRRQKISLLNQEIPSLSLEDAILVHCIYLSRDYWQKHERLSHICDIAQLINTHSPINWQLIIQEAQRLGITKMLLLGLYLAHTLFQSYIPDKIKESIQSNHKIIQLTRQITKALFLEANQLEFGLNRKLFYLQIRERKSDIISHLPYLFNYWITPTQTDQDFFSLPQSLSFLYYAVRQIRLLKKYAYKS